MDINIPALLTAFFLLLVLGAVLWYAARVAQPLPEAPAGPPTGALAMERKIIAIVAMTAAMALLFLGYGFREPARQAVTGEQQLDISIGRGITTFTSLCFPCHGEKGQGAVVPDSNPLRLAPQLNRPDLRPTGSDERGDAPPEGLSLARPAGLEPAPPAPEAGTVGMVTPAQPAAEVTDQPLQLEVGQLVAGVDVQPNRYRSQGGNERETGDRP